jgi:ubiquinol-cytochrome c reductase iron-sulfur subunit
MATNITSKTLPAQACKSPLPDAERRNIVLLTAATGGIAAVVTAVPFLSSLAPSERANAMGSAVEANISDIAEGSLKTFEWRGKPVWVMHRSPAMLTNLSSQDAELADPASKKDQQPEYARNRHRSIKPEYLVALGICTHLGCAPNAVAQGTNNPSLGSDWQGGFFCPCHGSSFDLAGRVFKNVLAPSNLEIPPHHYLTNGTLLIGENGTA